ncbi:MAG: signal peptidase II [Clostridia bacterium]|nr:signal peptidase II [Clostridia bacterium]
MVIFTIILISVFALDQILKYYIRACINLGDVLDTFLPFLKVTYIKNTGAAFGSMNGMRIYLIMFSALAIAGVIYYIFKKNIKNRYLLASVALALGGALSNLYDRIFYGFVTDYIKLTFFLPVCNVADYCICLGTVFVLTFILKNKNN